MSSSSPFVAPSLRRSASHPQPPFSLSNPPPSSLRRHPRRALRAERFPPITPDVIPPGRVCTRHARQSKGEKRKSKIFSQNEAKKPSWRYQKRGSPWLRPRRRPTFLGVPTRTARTRPAARTPASPAPRAHLQTGHVATLSPVDSPPIISLRSCPAERTRRPSGHRTLGHSTWTARLLQQKDSRLSPNNGALLGEARCRQADVMTRSTLPGKRDRRAARRNPPPAACPWSRPS
jgi:hypothetical protein